MNTLTILEIKKAELALARREFQEIQHSIRGLKAKAWDMSTRIGTLKAEIESVTRQYESEKKREV